ncbi:MAG: hypothetical protein EB059_07020 [Alphaproteobacteria bacterium]|nr:hypothetical protein [Alphaproteobacteria bacterium]
MKKFTILTAAVLALTLPGLASAVEANADVKTHTKVETQVEQKANGAYLEKRTDESASKNADGTETKDTTKTKVEASENGDVSKTVETHSAVDPKGLMNEKSKDSTYKEEMKDGKHTVHHTTKVDGKTTLDVKEEVNPKAK